VRKTVAVAKIEELAHANSSSFAFLRPLQDLFSSLFFDEILLKKFYLSKLKRKLKLFRLNPVIFAAR
jgi:hypothetical protein